MERAMEGGLQVRIWVQRGPDGAQQASNEYQVEGTYMGHTTPSHDPS